MTELLVESLSYIGAFVWLLSGGVGVGMSKGVEGADLLPIILGSALGPIALGLSIGMAISESKEADNG